MSNDLVVGAVGFGPNFATNPVDNEIIAELRAEVASLKREIAQYRRGFIILRKALQGCAALTQKAADEKHEALLAAEEPL